jgi:hypothetical protein
MRFRPGWSAGSEGLTSGSITASYDRPAQGYTRKEGGRVDLIRCGVCLTLFVLWLVLIGMWVGDLRR